MPLKGFSSFRQWAASSSQSDELLTDKSLLNRTRLDRFILVSIVFHLIIILAQGLVPVKPVATKAKKPIQVKYIEPEKPKSVDKRGTLVDAPKPEKAEKPRSKEILSSFDSRAHSNLKKNKGKEYRRHKTLVPKSGGRAGQSQKDQPIQKTQKTRAETKPATKERTIPLPESDRGTHALQDVKKQPESEQEKSKGLGSSLALLDGFDAEKYASLDTQSENMEETDDDEAVSLDTTETKYASYFARIKHQIERTWTYPHEAAQMGIKGELTLKFKISKDGNLLGVRLIDGSGHDVLDFAAIKAVKEAAPYYPFPVTIQKNKISILATFVYSPAYGLLNQ